MALSSEEQAYIEKNKLKRLTFDGIKDLYLHARYGALTVKDCIENDTRLKLLPKPNKESFQIAISDELSIRNERCIELNGFGLF